jgi:hypothetical protein
MFLIYNPSDIPDTQRVMDYWRELAQQAGLKGLHLVGVNYRHLAIDPASYGLDAATWQPMPSRNGHIPWRYPWLKFRMRLAHGKYKLTVYDYSEILGNLTRQSSPPFVEYPTVLPNWDNTPRSGLNGLVIHESSPELFQIVLRRAISLVQSYVPEQRIVFIKAWNEWAEGNHLEPDQKYGHAWLKVVHDELTRNG